MLFKIISKYKNTNPYTAFILFLITAFLVSFNGCVTTEIQQVQSEKLPQLQDSKILKLMMKDGLVIDLKDYNAKYYNSYKGESNVIVYMDYKTIFEKQDTVKRHYTEQIVNLKDVVSVVVESEEINTGMTILAATGVGLLIAVIVIAATANNRPAPPPVTYGPMSCPLVYTHNGSEFKLESETFAGAIIKPAERTTYDNLLHLQPVNGKIILKIADEMPETEFTNELNITAVDTKENVNIVTDFKGVFHTVTSGAEPVSCTDFKGNNVKSLIVKSDEKYWRSDLKYMDLSKEENLRDGLIIEFQKPGEFSVAKIVVKGVNTDLTVAAFQEIYRLKGRNKTEWLKQVESNPAEAQRLSNFLKREGMLHVMLWEKDSWVEQSIIRDPGPIVQKEQLAMLDLSNVTENTFKVKLESTTDLWKIDRVYADFSSDAEMTLQDLEIFSATDQNGNDVKDALSKPDDKYFVSFPGNYAIVIYNDITNKNNTYRHYMLRSSGYYHPMYETNNAEDKELYNKVMNEPLFGVKYFLNQWKVKVSGIK
jgi:hypothetical protein